MSLGLKQENEHLCGEIVKLRADLKTANELLGRAASYVPSIDIELSRAISAHLNKANAKERDT